MFKGGTIKLAVCAALALAGLLTRANAAETAGSTPLKPLEHVTVHDPSITKAGNEYYVFGSHIEAARSADLRNWTKFTNGYETPGNKLFGDLSKTLAGSFAWAGENDSDCLGGRSVWAPSVFWNKDYVNKDGSTGTYMMYYCTTSTYIRSAIGFALSRTIEGPYEYGNTVIQSGFTRGDSTDRNSVINTNYMNTNIRGLIEKGILKGPSENWFNAEGRYNNNFCPNAIDPEIFYDGKGDLWMCYGSWVGGIFVLQLDKKTGMPVYPGRDIDAKPNVTDRYFGVKVSGGYTKSGEGPEIVYDKANGYYYLYVSYGGLGARGGYNIRMFRARHPEGPYLDKAGNNAVLPGNMDNSPYGIKLIGNYNLNCLEMGYRSAGHNSSFIDDDGQMYLVYHTRYDNGTEWHQVRVHQMFLNEEGWPVTAPYEYRGDKISATGYAVEEIAGDYEFINHGNKTNAQMLPTLNVRLNADHTISGDVSGAWSAKPGTHYMSAVIGGVTYRGVFFKQQDESKFVNEVMTFTAVGDNNECIWGSKLALKGAEAAGYAARAALRKAPAEARKNLALPAEGPFGAKIAWSSSAPQTLSVSGAVARGAGDVSVTLTATATADGATSNATATVLVKGKLAKLDARPVYCFDFEQASGGKVASRNGTREGVAALEGSAAIVRDAARGAVLALKNAKGAVRANYLKLPGDCFVNAGEKGLTVGMWVNVAGNDPNYHEHSALFEANAGGQYPMARLGENLWGRINANGRFGDALEIARPLERDAWEYVTLTMSPNGVGVYLNGEQVGADTRRLGRCFENNTLARMTEVTVGSGNVWKDMDVSAAMFDDVAIFDTALNESQVEALYTQEAAAKTK